MSRNERLLAGYRSMFCFTAQKKHTVHEANEQILETLLEVTRQGPPGKNNSPSHQSLGRVRIGIVLNLSFACVTPG